MYCIQAVCKEWGVGLLEPYYCVLAVHWNNVVVVVVVVVLQSRGISSIATFESRDCRSCLQ